MTRQLTLLPLLALAVLACGCAVRPPPRPVPPRETWDSLPLWRINHNPETSATLASNEATAGGGLKIDYRLGGSHGYVEAVHDISPTLPKDTPVAFSVRGTGPADLEIKLYDPDGSVFRRTAKLAAYSNWTPLVVNLGCSDYAWGGDENFDGLSQFQLAVSGQGRGTMWFREAGPAAPGAAPSFPPAGPVLDPDRELPGIGFRQRRASELIPEDPLVLEGLKQLQDTSSPARQMLPSMQNNECQTFNNALVAMAFILKGERERAERILDFFAKATVRDNQDPTLQNFFYKGEARGFFQAVALNPTRTAEAYHVDGVSDRWMGDMAWLLFAYKYYEKTYGSNRYEEITRLLKNLLVSWYIDAPDGGPGGYVRHGWRKSDSKLHEDYGHPEGNIDCYAVFRLYGENDLAEKIKTWLDRVLKGNTQPLDNYTWRVLACGTNYARLLDIPDYDLRYRKTIVSKGVPAVGVYSHADFSITNIWFDGVGHIACAYFAAGNRERGNFYANQYDPFLIEWTVGGKKVQGIPYTANKTAGADWVHHDRGFISVAAWYLFAKNRFNPMTLEQY